MEATPGFEPGMKALQASALPLGHVATKHESVKRKTGQNKLMTGLLSTDGADDGIRTRDPDLGKVVLYQLSHVRIARNYINGTPKLMQVLFHEISE